MMCKNMAASYKRLLERDTKLTAIYHELRHWVIVMHEEGSCYTFRFAFMQADPDDARYLWVFTEHQGLHVFAFDELSGAWQLEPYKEVRAPNTNSDKGAVEIIKKPKIVGVKVVKEPDGDPAAERCCFCDKRTKYWYFPPGSRRKKINCNEVACCPECAKKHNPEDMPSKDVWCANQRLLHPTMGGY
jgi:hypothetical protein